MLVAECLIDELIHERLQVRAALNVYSTIHDLLIMLLLANLVADLVPGLESYALVRNTLYVVELKRIERNVDDHRHVIVLRSRDGSDHL